MKKTSITLLIIGSALITGCNPTGSNIASTSSTPVVDKADAVASVNGQYIPKSSLEALEKEIAERSHGQTFPKEKLIEELVQRELLVQDATQKQLEKTPEVINQLEVARKTLLTQATLQNYIKANPVTDEEIKAEYERQVASEKGTEYKARHILVKTEKEAKDRIAELDKGGDFAKLANKYSLDAKDSQNGGDLGWFSPAQMVPPFSDAVAKLEKGKYTKTPIQTQFGWHVILREDSRAQTPPALDAVKEQLKPFLQRKKVQTMLETLRKQAKVEILVPVDEKPKAETPAATAIPSSGEDKTTVQPVEAGAPDKSTETTASPVPAAEKAVEEAKSASKEVINKTVDAIKTAPEEVKK